MEGVNLNYNKKKPYNPPQVNSVPLPQMATVGLDIERLANMRRHLPEGPAKKYFDQLIAERVKFLAREEHYES